MPDVRRFDGVDDTIRCTGTLGQSANGPFTIVALVRLTTLPGADEPFFSIGNGTTATAATLYNDSGNSGANLAWGNSASDSIGNAGLVASQWRFVAGFKETGADSSVDLGSRQFGTGSWTWTTGTGTINNNTNVCTDAFFGRFNDTATFRDFDLAVCAIWNSALTRATIEGLEVTATTAGLAAASPIGLWDFNQASVATTVLDLVGNTHEVSRTGTTVVADGSLAWTFGLTSAPQQLTRTFAPIPFMK